MIILAIETSCDETSLAIVDNDRLIINRTYSQIKHHQQFAGVHPSIARRAHEERLPILLEQVLKTSQITFPNINNCDCTHCLNFRNSRLAIRNSIDALAVTVGPGLPPALETGITFAKHLAITHQLPLIPVNHLEGHIASVFLKRSTGTPFFPQIKHLAILPSTSHLKPETSNLIPETSPLKPVSCNLQPSPLQPETSLLKPITSPLKPLTFNLKPAISSLIPATSPLKPITLLSLIVSGGHTEIVLTHLHHNTPNPHSNTSNPSPATSLSPATSPLRPLTFNLKPAISSLIPATSPLKPLTFNLKPAISSLIPATSPLKPTHSLIGQTLDDAAGEVIDKVGRELGLGYPAGPALEAFAKQGNPASYKFPLPLKNTPQSDLNFSFSGLKTKAIQMLHGTHAISSYTQRDQIINRTPQLVTNFAASFQQAVIDSLVFKLNRALNLLSKSNPVDALIITGGVSANQELRRQIRKLAKQHQVPLLAAPTSFTGDNAAMIGLAAQWAVARGEIATTPKQIQAIDRQPNLNFSSSQLHQPLAEN